MRAGELNRRIRIQQQSSQQDEYGQPINTWTDVLDCWARIRAVTGKEIYASSGYTSQLTHTIAIRYPQAEVRSNMRVLYGERAWNIQAVSNPDEGTQTLTLLCQELNEGR